MRSVAPRLPSDAIEKTKALIAASLPNPDRPDEAIPEHGLQSLSPAAAGEGAVALAAVWEEAAVAALAVCRNAGTVARGEEEAFAATVFAAAGMVAAVLCAEFGRSLCFAAFLEMNREDSRYTSSRPPSVKNFFPTQMRCASFTARSTFGCRSGLR